MDAPFDDHHESTIDRDREPVGQADASDERHLPQGIDGRDLADAQLLRMLGQYSAELGHNAANPGATHGGEQLVGCVRPSAAEVEEAKAELKEKIAEDAPGGTTSVGAEPEPPEPDATKMRTDEISRLQEKMQDTSDTKQLLDNISNTSHNTNMSIIGNMR